jgi:TonB-dependent Receptor Plug Domain
MLLKLPGFRLVAIAIWLWPVSPALAQVQRGQIRIEVRDSTGATVAASGEILSQGNEFHRDFRVPSQGNVLLQDLPFGVYRLTLNAPGFTEWDSLVEVHSVVPRKLTAMLGVAPVTTQVRVSDQMTLVDPSAVSSDYSVGRVAIRDSVSAQPGRELAELTASQPGWIFESNGVLHPRGSEYDVQFVIDGQPLTQNRSPAFAPDMDAEDYESMRVLTAGFPAEYGRKLGGVVELSSDRSMPTGWHGEIAMLGGSFANLAGTAAVAFATTRNRFAVRGSGLHSDRYLDPPVPENYTNSGNSSGIFADYEHDFNSNDRLRISFLHDTLGYVVPNDLVQQNQAIGPQRQNAGSTENGGQVYFQHSISPELFLSFSGGVRASSFLLRCNRTNSAPNRAQNWAQRGHQGGDRRG